MEGAKVMMVAWKIGRLVFVRATGVVKEGREDDLLKAGEQGRDAYPETPVGDLCITGEMTARVKEAKYQLSRLSVCKETLAEARVPYSLHKIREDDEFEAN
jgi:hypothetical protein